MFIAIYSRHSSIILPTGDNRMVEYAFGDWAYFAENRDQWFNGIEALLASKGAGLGRRYFACTADDPTLEEKVWAKKIVPLKVETKRLRALQESLDARFAASAWTAVHNPENGLVCVRDPEKYSLGHNCNHVTARWLEELGCQVEGRSLGPEFKVKKMVR